MKYIDYITDYIISDIEQIVTYFKDYNYLTWIFVCGFYIIWMMIKYTLITMPFRMLFQPILYNFYKTIIISLPKSIIKPK